LIQIVDRAFVDWADGGSNEDRAEVLRIGACIDAVGVVCVRRHGGSPTGKSVVAAGGFRVLEAHFQVKLPFVKTGGVREVVLLEVLGKGQSKRDGGEFCSGSHDVVRGLITT
jgi:hypothetical protein